MPAPSMTWAPGASMRSADRDDGAIADMDVARGEIGHGRIHGERWSRRE